MTVLCPGPVETEFRIPDDADIVLLKQPLAQDALGAEVAAPVNDSDTLGEVGEVERLFDRRIAAADHRDILAAIEEAVASSAGRHAEAHEGLLRRDAQPLGLRAGGDYQRIRGVDRAGIASGTERPHIEVDLGDDVVDDLGADMLGLFEHLLHQPRTLDRIGKARIVFDIGGDHQLAALLQAGDKHRLQHGAGGIDRRRVARRAGADDDELGGDGSFGTGHPLDPALWRQMRARSA